MNEILKTKFFSLLSDTSKVTNEEMQNAYECFMEKLKTISQSEKDYFEIFRKLNNTRIELVFIESLHQYGQGKKCLEIRLSY